MTASHYNDCECPEINVKMDYVAKEKQLDYNEDKSGYLIFSVSLFIYDVYVSGTTFCGSLIFNNTISQHPSNVDLQM